MEKLLIIASLGRVRPLKFQSAGDDPLEQEHLVEEPGRVVEMNLESLSEVVSDQSGRFTQSAPPGRKAGMSYGEGHNLEAEREKQALKHIAKEIGKLVGAEGNPSWRLVAPKEIMPSLLRALPASARNSVAKTETGDLTKLPLRELEKRLLSRH